MPQLRIVGSGHRLPAVAGLDQRPFHVRLPAGQPHIADQHIAHLQLAPVALHTQHVRATGCVRRQLDLPLPCCIGLGDGALAVEADRDRGIGRRPAPDRHRLIALQHGAIGEQQRQCRHRPGTRTDQHQAQQAATTNERSGHAVISKVGAAGRRAAIRRRTAPYTVGQRDAARSDAALIVDRHRRCHGHRWRSTRGQECAGHR